LVQTHGEVSETLKGLFVGSIATIPLVWNVENHRPLLLFVTSWHSLLSTSHLLFQIVSGSVCWYHAGRIANIKVDHSLDQHIPTHYFLQYLGCTVLQLSCPDRDFEAHTSQFQCAIHDAPCWSEGKARENIEHLHAPWSQRNATCSEKTVGKSMHYKDVHRIIGGGSRFQVSIPESFPLNKAEFRILNHSFTI